MSRLLVDTNVLLRTLQTDDPRHGVAVASIGGHLQAGDELCFCNQIAAEFVRVATAASQLGLEPGQAFAAFDGLTGRMTWLDEPRSVLETLRSLLIEGKVRVGVNIYDGKLAALALHHRLDGILTFNAKDFARSGLATIEPAKIA